MRIQPGLITEIKKALSESSDTSKGVVQTLKAGDKLTAVILSVLEEWVSLDVKGDVIHAKNVGSQSLVENETVMLEVVESDGKTIEVKLTSDAQINETKSELDVLLKEQLMKLGVAQSPRNTMVLKAMHEQNIVITKQNFQNLQQSLFYLQDASTKLDAMKEPVSVNWQASPKEFMQLLTLIPQEQPSQVQEQEQPALQQTTSQNDLKSSPQQLPLNQEVMDPTSPSKVVVDPLKPILLGDVLKDQHTPVINHNKGEDVALLKSQFDKIQVQTQHLNLANVDSEQTVKNARNMVLKHFESSLEIALKDMVQNPERTTQTLAFMTKNDLPLTVLNTVVANQFLTGKLGMMQGLESLFNEGLESLPKELRDQLTKSLISPLKWQDLPDKLDGNMLKNMMEEVENLQKTLQQTSIRSQTGEKVEQFELIKQTQALLNDTSMNWHALYLPVQVERQLEEVEVYIKGDPKKKGAINPDDGLVYIALHTKNMSLVRVKIHLQPDFIKLDIMTDDTKVEAFMKDYVNELASRLAPLTKKEILIDFSTNVEVPNLAELEKVNVIGASSFDVRI